MFIITDSKNPKRIGILWDKSKNKPLIKFSDGKATTESRDIAEKLQKLGFKVDGLSDNKPIETNTEEVVKPTRNRKKEV